MKTCLHAFIMCQSMFCAIPAPQIWDEKARDKMLSVLPRSIEWLRDNGFDFAPLTM